MAGRHPSGLLAGYADGELEPRLRAQVDGHLPVCPACRRALDDVRRVNALLAAALSPPPVSAVARARTLARIRAGITMRRPRSVGAWAGLMEAPALLGTAALVLLAVVEAASFGGLEEQVLALALYLGLI